MSDDMKRIILSCLSCLLLHPVLLCFLSSVWMLYVYGCFGKINYDDDYYYFIIIMNVKLYSWPLTLHKVVRQQIWGEMVVLIPTFSADPFWIYQSKNYEHWSMFVEIIVHVKAARIFWDTVYN